MIRVLLADDQAIYRQLIRATIESEVDIEVVAEAADGDDAIALVDTHAPDVVLLDVRMPDRSGIEVARVVTARNPSVRILMLTISDDSADMYDAILAGALGYLLKDHAPDRVVPAIRRVYEGRTYLSPSMTGLLAARLGQMFDGDPRRELSVTELSAARSRLVEH